MAQTYNETVVAEVRAEMGRRRLSQEDLAAELGWTQEKVSRRLTGTVTFSTNEVEQVATALGIPLSQLVTPSVQAAAIPP
jgi:transcriptional regulator with XRE-family HTH domain